MEAGDTKVGQEYEKNAEIDVSIVVEEAQQDSDKKDERKENRIPEWIDPFRPPHNAKPPAWCEILINNPREFPRGELYGECGRKHNDVLCADGKPMYFGPYRARTPSSTRNALAGRVYVSKPTLAITTSSIG